MHVLNIVLSSITVLRVENLSVFQQYGIDRRCIYNKKMYQKSSFPCFLIEIETFHVELRNLTSHFIIPKQISRISGIWFFWVGVESATITNTFKRLTALQWLKIKKKKSNFRIQSRLPNKRSHIQSALSRFNYDWASGNPTPIHHGNTAECQRNLYRTVIDYYSYSYSFA